MTADGGPADVANAPYVSTGSNNYYELYLSSTRKTRKHDHALKHCFAMAKHCYQSSRFPEGCDWLVAAAAVRAIKIMDGVWFEVIDGMGRLVGCVVGVGGIGSA